VNNSIRLMLLAAGLLLLSSGCGVTGNKRLHPGYANFDFPAMMDSDRVFALSVGQLPLKIAAWAIDEDEEPELAGMLRELKAVRVYIFELEERPDRSLQRIRKTGQRLVERGWSSLVRVSDDGEQTHVLARLDGNAIAGLAVLTGDEEEAVFVNMIGNIRPEMFNDIMQELNTGIDVALSEEQLATLHDSAG